MTNRDDRMNNHLRRLLYRLSCPSSLELGEYHLGELEQDRATALRSHLQECPHCARELSQLEGFLREVGPDIRSIGSEEYGLAERIKVWVAERLPDLSQGAGTFAPAFALRGGPAGPRLYRAGPAEISLEIARDAQEENRHTMLGLVTGVDPDKLEVSLWHQSQRASATRLDDLGNFVFSGVEPGAYELVLTGPDFEIYLADDL
jgi:hypothetical protein